MSYTLYAMAFNRSEVIRKLENVADPIVEHLSKILLLKAGSETQHRWGCEINAWLTRIAPLRLKPKNTPPSTTLVVKELTSVALFSDPQLYIAMWKVRYPNLAMYESYKSNLTNLQDNIRAIIADFATLMASGKFVGLQNLTAYKQVLKFR